MVKVEQQTARQRINVAQCLHKLRATFIFVYGDAQISILFHELCFPRICFLLLVCSYFMS